MRNDFESNYLAHHGILGQKWGYKNGPPYPLDEGDHSSSEKKAGWRKSLVSAIKDHKKKKQRAKALEKARKTKAENAKKAAEKQAYEDEKQRVLKSGKASEILKYQGDLTNKELSDAVSRLDWERRLNEISAKEVQTNWDKMDSLMNKVGKVTDYVNKGANAYDAIKRVTKIFEPKDDKDKEKKEREEAINKVVNSRNRKEIERYASLMDNKQLANALAGLKSQETYNEMFKSDREKKKEAKAAEKEKEKQAKADAKEKEREEDLKQAVAQVRAMAEKSNSEYSDYYDDEPQKQNSKSSGSAKGIKGQDWTEVKDNSKFMADPFVTLDEYTDDEVRKIEKLLRKKGLI